ncbi:ABC-F family ATP-binding cassette domain-containing protein [Streptomyces californicus]
MASVRQLTSALESFEGALLVAGHDLPFLESVGVTRWIVLDDTLRETDADGVRELFANPDSAPAGTA